MRRLAPVTRMTASPRRQVSSLVAAAGAVLVSFFLVPDALARTSVSTANVGDSFRRGFVLHWQSGSQDLPPRLETTVAFWFRFHLVKAGISALLLVVTVALGVVLWRHFRQRPGKRSARLRRGLCHGAVGMLGLFALVALMANVQGAVAPYASLLPMLTTGGAEGELAATLAQVRQQADAPPHSGESPVLAFMVREFAVYHAVLAVMAGVITCVLVGTSIVLWKRSRASDGQSKHAPRTGAAVSALWAAVALVLAFSNAANAANSPQALARFFTGSW